MSTALKYPTNLPDFLTWEERQAERWEFVDGRVWLMAGGTYDHSRIGNNLRGELHRILRNGSCKADGPDLKLVTPEGDAMYPDVLVRCGPPLGRQTSCDDPVVIIEVLSPSTAWHDLSRKRRAYKAIPSLRLLVYVSTEEPWIDILRRRPDGNWEESEVVEGLEATMRLPEIGAEVAMHEIYAGSGLGGA